MPSVKHGGGNVMVCGCSGAWKVGDLHKEKGLLNKEGYHSIWQFESSAHQAHPTYGRYLRKLGVT